MNLSGYCLILGGVASLLIAVLHVVLAIRPQAYRYFGAAELAQLAEQGSSFTVLVTIGLALMFAAWGAYALSGAGVIRRLPSRCLLNGFACDRVTLPGWLVGTIGQLDRALFVVFEARL